MRITKRQLRRIIREEAADCIKDYMLMGYSRSQAAAECGDDEDDRFSRWDSRRRSPRKTTYVGAESNADQIAAVENAISAKSGRHEFLQSILRQLNQGRGLSSKQKGIVRKILSKIDPESASLFEKSTVRITLNQLREIIREAEDRSGRVGGGNQWGDGEDDLNEQGGSDAYDADADEWYEYRHQEDQMDHEDYMMDSLYDIIEKNPGLSGDDLIKSAMQDGIFGGKTKEEIFDVADQMVNMSTLKFDLEEDQWWIDRSEDLYSPSHQADLDHANQTYIDQHGDPYED